MHNFGPTHPKVWTALLPLLFTNIYSSCLMASSGSSAASGLPFSALFSFPVSPASSPSALSTASGSSIRLAVQSLSKFTTRLMPRGMSSRNSRTHLALVSSFRNESASFFLSSVDQTLTVACVFPSHSSMAVPLACLATTNRALPIGMVCFTVAPVYFFSSASTKVFCTAAWVWSADPKFSCRIVCRPSGCCVMNCVLESVASYADGGKLWGWYSPRSFARAMPPWMLRTLTDMDGRSSRKLLSAS
mmetsp:Transcript_11219/g.31037  ORF Transcript_11219/g.31037 Transcript_11219/m.31037 type:complete len:246 (-) Transcript_11219:66-803(-)